MEKVALITRNDLKGTYIKLYISFLLLLFFFLILKKKLLTIIVKTTAFSSPLPQLKFCFNYGLKYTL